MALAFVAVLMILALGGAGYVYAGAGRERQQKRLAAVSRPSAQLRAGAGDTNALKRKNVQQLLQQIESKSAAQKQRVTMRRRLDMAGMPDVSVNVFWMVSGGLGLGVAAVCFVLHQSLLVDALAAFGAGLGLPRWVVGFMKNRREKKFTGEFANAIDVIVRSVRSGLPTNEALRIVARESPDPVGSEFSKLVEGMKVGVTLEQGCKRMYESMPTPEVSFFGIVMTIQQKSGGNLSEALSNLAGVLRDRKRLAGKIKAMSSEAKASAGIIGSLPPAVMGIVWVTTPAYISLLFTEKTGNLMLAGCAIWMATGIFVMRKMINFKH
ncbi:MAG TPA: type II secretion system F family protein [Rhizomicrobium sp.]|jgi:tight adherence protein B|nr:type II secretion system F family protein [Rhizomicrobium sp.]